MSARLRKPLSTSIIQLLVAVFFFGLFAIFTLIVRHNHLDMFDFDTTVRIQDHLPTALDTLFSTFSLLGSTEIISFLLLATIFYYRARIVPIFSSYCTGLFIELLGKTYLNHPGPPSLFFRYDLGFFFPSFYIETQHSYPSGHSFRAVFIAVIWSWLIWHVVKSKTTRWLLLCVTMILSLAMLVSRVSLGEHWTTDVIGGTLLGISLAIGSLSFKLKRLER